MVQWTLSSYKHDCLVHSVIVLLRREADSPRLTGEFFSSFQENRRTEIFRYQVLRVWQMSADALASGGWGLFPLAPLCDDANTAAAGLDRTDGKSVCKNEVADPQKQAMLWETTAILSDHAVRTRISSCL